MSSLHIVSFNVPFPANYGGVIDVYYRIRALSQLGVKIHLHTFTYGRPHAPELDALCESVTYYPRHTGILSFLSSEPYIVKSRHNSNLVDNLNRDNYPILLEGLHCCSVLEALNNHINTVPAVSNGGRVQSERLVFVRAHNVEHDYYNRLADAERNPFRRFYLRTEARRLLRFESILTSASGIFAVTQADADHFREIGCRNVWLMPSSHPGDSVISLPGLGNYALYHADLSVPENIQAVLFLLRNIFANSPHRLVIAGRNPHKSIIHAVDLLPNVSLLANPDDASMQKLIADAQVNILVTNQSTGLKLKLLNSLYAGRHCLVNSLMVAGTPLGHLCTVADDPHSLANALDSLMHQPFTQHDKDLRNSSLGNLYSNSANALILASKL